VQKRPKSTIILGVTGSVAAYKACDVIGGLKKMGLDVVVVMTKEATHFITPLTLQSLSCNKVYSEMFDRPAEWEPQHISLAARADLILIAPCSANIIGKIANGICDDLLTCTVISGKAKVLIAPAMNKNMYANSIVQDNITKLKTKGYKFIGPIKGHLACGTEGIGHIAEVQEILGEVKKLLR